MPDELIVDASHGLDKIAAALSKAQAAIVPPKKSHTAKVPTKAGSSYAYTYSTLDELIEALRKPLAEQGLSFIQRIVQQDRLVGVETNILHASGQILYCGALLLPSGETPQAMGSALSYARRYSLAAAFGVAAEEDDDAQTAQRETTAKATKPTPPVSRDAGDEPPDDPFGDFDGPAPTPQASAHDTSHMRTGPAPADWPRISEAQQKRLFAIAMKAGWTKDSLRGFLEAKGYAHSNEIARAHYNDLCAAIESGPEVAP